MAVSHFNGLGKILVPACGDTAAKESTGPQLLQNGCCVLAFYFTLNILASKSAIKYTLSNIDSI